MDQRPLNEPRRIPLADRVRPRTLSELVGLEEVVGPDTLLGHALAEGSLPSIVLWGPPGCGKTTLARILAREADLPFITFSAVTSGVKEIRAAIAEAIRRGSVVLFVDEIHRFNKSQQDAFLHAVEEGRIILMGATTENPSFELNSALLSRMRVITMPPLTREALILLLQRALTHEKGLKDVTISNPEALEGIAAASGGDARVALTILEHAVEENGAVTVESVERAALHPIPRYDKKGEGHYNLISALHKSVRNSDPQAALYYLARMLIGGEDPLYIARRLMRAAVEDVGLADPHALPMAVAAKEAVHFMGMPECALALAQLAVYLSVAPKSNAIYTGYGRAREKAAATPEEPVPLTLRNAPTALMKNLGYGKDYIYAHDTKEGVAAMECLPPSLQGAAFYRPTVRGFEKEITRLMEAIRQARN